MNVSFASILPLLFILSGAVVSPSSANVLDVLSPRDQLYPLRISRAFSYQLNPGDTVEVDVIFYSKGQRVQSQVVQKVQIRTISEAPPNMSILRFALTKKEVRSMYKALSKPQARIALQVIKRAVMTTRQENRSTDGIEDLDFDTQLHVANRTDNEEDTK